MELFQESPTAFLQVGRSACRRGGGLAPCMPRSVEGRWASSVRGVRPEGLVTSPGDILLQPPGASHLNTAPYGKARPGGGGCGGRGGRCARAASGNPEVPPWGAIKQQHCGVHVPCPPCTHTRTHPQELRKGKYVKVVSTNRDVLHTVAELQLPVESVAASAGVSLLPAPTIEALLVDKRRLELVQPFKLALLKLASQVRQGGTGGQAGGRVHVHATCVRVYVRTCTKHGYRE